MVNGNKTEVPEVGGAVQTVKCGAVLQMTPELLEHGIAFLHETLPLFKLYLKIAPDGKVLHTFQICEPLFPEVKKFAIELVPSADVPLPTEVPDPAPKKKSTLIMPEA